MQISTRCSFAPTPVEDLSGGTVDIALPDGDQLERCTVRASWRALTNASRYWETMRRVPMREQTTGHIVETFPVGVNTWRRLIYDLHEAETMRPRLDEAVGLHALIDYLMPKDTRSGRALTRLSDDCLQLLDATPEDEVSDHYCEAVARNDERTSALLARRILARLAPTDPDFLELPEDAFVDLMRRAANVANTQRVACIAAWCEAHAVDGDKRALAQSLAVCALRNSAVSAMRWRAAGFFGADECAPRLDDAFRLEAWEPLSCTSIMPCATGVWSVQCTDEHILLGSIKGVFVLDAKTGETLHKLDKDVLYAHARANDRYMVRSAADAIEVYTMPELRPVARLPCEERIESPCAIGLSWIVAGDGRGVGLWNEKTLRAARSMFHYSKDAAAVAADNRQVATVSYCGNVALWDLATRDFVHQFANENARGSRQIALTDYHVIASSEHGVCIWDRVGFGLRHTLPTHEPVSALSAQDDLLVVACENELTVWNALTGEKLQTLTGHTQTVNAIAIHNGSIVTAGWDESVRVWARA